MIYRKSVERCRFWGIKFRPFRSKEEEPLTRRAGTIHTAKPVCVTDRARLPCALGGAYDCKLSLWRHRSTSPSRRHSSKWLAINSRRRRRRRRRFLAGRLPTPYLLSRKRPVRRECPPLNNTHTRARARCQHTTIKTANAGRSHAVKVKFHDSGFHRSNLVASSWHPREDVRNKSGVPATMSRGCYEETAVVEFRLNSWQ